MAVTLAAGCASEVTEDGPGNPATSAGANGSGAGAGAGNNGSNSGNPGGSTGPGGTTAPGAGNSTGNPTPGGGSNGAGGTPGGAGSTSANCTPNVPGTSQIPRLTNDQYDRTVRDLLGVTTVTALGNAVPSTRLATDQAGGMTALAWANYKDVGEKIAAQVMADPKLKANFLKCTPTAGDTTCLHNTITEFGRRAFRRPLTQAEVARFDKIVSAGATITPSGKPEEVAEVLLNMFLISPSFLQRAEIAEVSDNAGHFTLTAHEIASRLSYMLWGTMPDAALSQAADQGQLSSLDQVATQARRMLQDPKAREMVNKFHQAYLVMRAEGRWGKAQRDPSLFPSFKPEMVPTLTEETLRIFDKLAFTPGATFRDFFLTPVAFVNKSTAPLYGLDASKYGTELTEVTLDANQRPGFLTRLGFLINFSSYTRTNPIYRGAFISKEVLGIAIPAPPPGAADTPLPSGADLTTNRKQVDAQTSGANCIGCHHTFINPPGFVMETFDAVGAIRTKDGNQPLDTKADVTFDVGASAATISSPAELMARIAASPGAMRQYAKKWVGFAFERENDPADECTVNQLAAKMANNGYAVLDLVTDITQTQVFRVRAVEVSQ
ncbi:MAG TPA: DUF1592 domain-containing protein [Polyangiaceae bacterium]|nr:DUF1592 domain-containing protein [Polyangiaceae bacterium]